MIIEYNREILVTVNKYCHEDRLVDSFVFLASMQVCKYATQVYMYARMQVYKYVSMPVRRYADMQICKYTSVQVYNFASKQIWKYASMQALK